MGLGFWYTRHAARGAGHLARRPHTSWRVWALAVAIVLAGWLFWPLAAAIIVVAFVVYIVMEVRKGLRIVKHRIAAALAAAALTAALGLGACTSQQDATTNATITSQQHTATQSAAMTAGKLRSLLKTSGAIIDDPSTDDVSRDAWGDLSIMGVFPDTNGEDIRIYENGDGTDLPTCSNENSLHTWDMLGEGWWAVMDGGHGINNFPIKPQAIADRLSARLLPLCEGVPTP